MKKTLGLIWNIFWNIVVVFVVISVLSAASDRFEALVLVVLVLIWLSVTGFAAQWGLSQIKLAENFDNDFEEIRRLLNHWKNIEDYTDEYLKEVRVERARVKKNVMTKVYINSGFQFLLFIIALYHLFIALNP